MKILITGGAGFIGSHLVDYWIRLKHDVVVIDDQSSPAYDAFYCNRLARYYKYDICDREETRRLYDGVDFVFHLAAQSRIQPSLDDPLTACRVNDLGTLAVLQNSLEAKVKRVIYSSSSSIYGLVNKPPLTENMPEDCLNPYSLSKRAGEKWCQLYYKLHGLETVILRYFNVYGPRQALVGVYAPIIGLFLKQHSAGEPLTIVPSGYQRRDFTHVFDVVAANIAATLSLEAPGEIFNIGTGINYSILELARMISEKTVMIDERIGEAKSTLADFSKANRILGWSPTKSLKEYLQEELSK